MREVQVCVGKHLLLFYDRETDLVADVGSHLVEGMHNGEVVVVVATAEHRDGIRRHLKTAGLDGVEIDKRLIELDAAGTLSRLLIDGKVSADRFYEVIGTAIQDATESGRPVRAYGEMVTLLWEAGDVFGAIDLESLWNDLQAKFPFSLLCAYPGRTTEKTEHDVALSEICALHSGIRDAQTVLGHQVTARFDATVDAPAAARRLLVETLRTWGFHESVISDATIVMAELTANAVSHVGEPFLVTISWKRDTLRISVRDPDSVTLVATRAGSTALSGRGLSMVEVLARKWGVSVARDHKTVWADLVAPIAGP